MNSTIETFVSKTLLNDYVIDELTTDAGSAKCLIDRIHPNFKYCNALGGWLRWNEVRWALDDDAIWNEVAELGKLFMVEAAMLAKREGDSLYTHGRYLQSTKGIGNVIALAKRDSRVKAEAGDFDADQYLLNLVNGTLDLKTLELRDHNRNDLITKLAPVEYQHDAESEIWSNFIERVLPDAEVREYVQKAVGQALTGAMETRSLYINHGLGANGKSTFFDTILTALGDYAGTIDIEVLMQKQQGGGTSPEIAQLILSLGSSPLYK